MQNAKRATKNAERRSGWPHSSFRVFRCVFCILQFGVLIAVSGCSDSVAARPEGPPSLAVTEVSPATFGSVYGRRVLTAHYRIDTTIADAEAVDRLAQVMEGAYGQYRKLAPDVSPSADRLQCFVFADRNQWAQFTESQTGADAKVYLRINRGGYAVRDWFVSYFIGSRETLSVAAHEGFHQYVGRHFQRRPPPFVEEGLATLFEYVDWEGDLPRWRWTVNPTRTNALVRAVRDDALLPLTDLCTMHAGQVVSNQIWKVEGFYAQAWAFARFLRDGEGGKYREGLKRMLADLASATGPAANAGPGPGGMWNPRSARPLLEHYLGNDLASIDVEYQAFIRRLAENAYKPNAAD